MPETLFGVEPEKLYEREIARLQGELSTLEVEKGKLEHRNTLLSETNSDLEKKIEKARETLVKLGEENKEKQASFEESRANSMASLNIRDDETVARESQAAEKEQAATAAWQKAHSARNQLISIAEDMQKTVQKIRRSALSFADSVEQELAGYLALREASTEIPTVPKK